MTGEVFGAANTLRTAVIMRGSAVFDGDAVGKIEGIVDVEGPRLGHGFV